VHDNASHIDTPAATDGRTPTSVFLSWSGPDSQAISTAFKELLLAIDPDRVDPFHSDDMESPDPWREQIKKAVARSQVAVLCLVPASLSSTWLMYEAGAFFEGGDTYILACGVDDEALKDTPLEAFQLKDARNSKSVRGLARLLLKPSDMAAFDKKYDEAWPAFDAVVKGIHCQQERVRRRTRLAKLGAAPLAVLLCAAATAGWYFRVPLQCMVVGGQACANLQWKAFVEEGNTKANPNFDKKVSRRPFAVVAVGGACSSGSVPWASIVGPTESLGTHPVPVVFARSNFDQNEKVAPAVVLGNSQSSALLDRACQTGPRGEIFHVRYIGTLSDDQLCDRALEFDEFFESRQALSRNLASFLHTLGVPRDPPLERRLDEWLKRCGVPDRPR
jgi:TIR domain